MLGSIYLPCMKLPFKVVSNNKEIDRSRWNDCIRLSENGLIYGQTFYLDNICPGWQALIHENYEWVFPLTARSKWGIRYLYQPAFTQQLGLFANNTVAVPYNAIFQWLKTRFQYWQFNWNFGFNGHPAQGVECAPATNYVIDLGAGYAAIAASYHKDFKNNLQRSSKFSLTCSAEHSHEQSIALYRQFYADRMPHVTEKDYSAFINMCQYAWQHNLLINRAVTATDGTVLSTALLLFDGRRLYNIMNTTTSAGRNQEANHYLLNAIIREFAGQQILFDFEGSDLPGVKTFYQNFGGQNQPYFTLKYNGLPWPLKLLKQ